MIKKKKSIYIIVTFQQHLINKLVEPKRHLQLLKLNEVSKLYMVLILKLAYFNLRDISHPKLSR